ALWRRADRPPLRDWLRLRRRRAQGTLSQGSYLPLPPVRLTEPASARVEDASNPAGGLAGRPAAGADRARAAAPDPRPSLGSASPVVHLATGSFGLVDDVWRAAGDSPLCGHANQDLEQRADRAPAAGTGNAAARGSNRGARQPDQPALPVQHPDVDHVPDSNAARDGPDVDYQALGVAPPVASKHGSFREPSRGARVHRAISG